MDDDFLSDPFDIQARPLGTKGPSADSDLSDPIGSGAQRRKLQTGGGRGTPLVETADSAAIDRGDQQGRTRAGQQPTAS
jgi:hypothetical protein